MFIAGTGRGEGPRSTEHSGLCTLEEDDIKEEEKEEEKEVVEDPGALYFLGRAGSWSLD